MNPNTDIGILLDAPIRVMKKRRMSLTKEVDLALESTSPAFKKLFAVKPCSIWRELEIVGTHCENWRVKKPGYTRGMPNGEDFWERYEPYLALIFRHAHASWKTKLKDCAMRLDEPIPAWFKKQLLEKVVRLNLAWEFVEKTFNKRGVKL